MPKKDVKKDSEDNKVIKELHARIDELEKSLAEKEEVTKRAQSDYFRTKMEFDEYVKRSEQAKKNIEIDWLISALEKVLPFVHQLKQTIDATPEVLEGDAWATWVSLVYDKVIADLWYLWVSEISVDIGSDPDYTLHIPIWMEETADESLKNKIVKIVEPWFVYKKNDIEKVISPAKVVVGS